MREPAITLYLRHHLDVLPRHLVVRRLLSGHLGCVESAVALSRTAAGKPYLRSPPGRRLHFSVSHCPGMLALAVGEHRPLGIDAELRRRPDAPAFRRFMTLAEREELDRSDSAVIVPWWVRKEAVLKAAGLGLRADPRDWPVTLLSAPDGQRVTGRFGDVYRVRDLSVGPYALAVARAGDEHFSLLLRADAAGGHLS